MARQGIKTYAIKIIKQVVSNIYTVKFLLKAVKVFCVL